MTQSKAMATTRRADPLWVRDAMHPDVATCARTTPLSDVARVMVAERLHCIVVTDGFDQDPPLWGLISDLDLVAAWGIGGLEGQLAEGSATATVVTISPDETLRRAAQLMTRHAIPYLVVTDPGTTRPIGVLSTLDIATALTHQ